MCPKLTLAATALSLMASASAMPAFAAAPAAPAAVAQSAPAPTLPAAAPIAKPASAEARAAIGKMEPLERAAFWANEVNKNPKDAEAGVKLSIALRQLGRYDEAYNAGQAVLAQQPDNVDGLLETARAAIASGQGFYAIAPMKTLQTLKPKDWRAPSLLGIAYAQSEQPDLALAAHNQAIALAPLNPGPLCNLGMFLAEQGDRTQAEQVLRKAAALPGATAQVRQDLALVLGLQGKLAEAERLERQDLPPQIADANLAYLKAASSPVPPPTAAAPVSKGRDWNSLAKAQE